MQKSKALGLIIGLIICSTINMSFTTQDIAISGMWHVTHIVFDGSTESGRKYLSFKEDGTLQGGRIGEAPNKFGTWSYNTETNIISLQDEDPSRQLDEFSVKTLTQTNLVLAGQGMEIHLEKKE